MKLPFFALLTIASTAAAHAQIRITEFYYQGRGGTPGGEHEFVELTNLGETPVNVDGWYYRDSTNNPATPFSLSGFGSIAPGESVVFTDLSEADFRTVWSGLGAEVKVMGNAVPGLGRNDTIRIFDSSDNLVDQLAYGDEAFPGTGRYRWVTAVTTTGNLGANNIAGWMFSADSVDNTPADAPFASRLVDMQGNTVFNLISINGDIGTPGIFAVAVPEPSTFWIGAGVFALAAFRLRRRLRKAGE